LEALFSWVLDDDGVVLLVEFAPSGVIDVRVPLALLLWPASPCEGWKA
jgi:hypothetical protein